MEWIRCRLCGALPAQDVGHGHALCGDCARKYQLSSCPTCGVTMLYQRAMAPPECSECRARAQLDDLSADRRDALDALVRERAWLRAVMLLREADPSLGLGDAQSLVSARRAQLDVSLDPPLAGSDVDE